MLIIETFDSEILGFEVCESNYVSVRIAHYINLVNAQGHIVGKREIVFYQIKFVYFTFHQDVYSI